MDATKEEIEGLINNYKKALLDYPLSAKERIICEKKIKFLEKKKKDLGDK
jgi:hypothetical protein